MGGGVARVPRDLARNGADLSGYRRPGQGPPGPAAQPGPGDPGPASVPWQPDQEIPDAATPVSGHLSPRAGLPTVDSRAGTDCLGIADPAPQVFRSGAASGASD